MHAVKGKRAAIKQPWLMSARSHKCTSVCGLWQHVLQAYTFFLHIFLLQQLQIETASCPN
jgi:hypothetical protein